MRAVGILVAMADDDDDPGTLVHVDSRGRASLGAQSADGDYLITCEPGGVLVLVPAVVMSRAEAALLECTDMLARIDANRRHPDRRVGRPHRDRDR
jgi:hypothetical protein